MTLPSRRLTPFTTRHHIDGADITLAGLSRHGTGTPLLFLHGFGSTKEDYADIIQHPALDHHPVIAYDAPGCGSSTTTRPDRVTIDHLTRIAHTVLTEFGYPRAHLIGHSMGGLTALTLAHAHPDLAAGFINIEGNLAPEDCFLSRQIVEHPRDTAQSFFDDFRSRVAASRFAASALYAAALRAKVIPEVVEPIFRSMVDLSDNTPLLEHFLALSGPRMLMYGDQNAGLSYLSTLAANGVELAEIPACGHFPMYSNTPVMWERITHFLQHASTTPPTRG